MKNNSAIPSVPQATPEDIQAITEASRDYAEGWFTANAEQMRRSLHPQLVKRTIWHDLQTGTWQPSNSHDAYQWSVLLVMEAAVPWQSLRKYLKS